MLREAAIAFVIGFALLYLLAEWPIEVARFIYRDM